VPRGLDNSLLRLVCGTRLLGIPCKGSVMLDCFAFVRSRIREGDPIAERTPGAEPAFGGTAARPLGVTG
jgi:hypothetical protein